MMSSERLMWVVLVIAGIALLSMITPSCGARTGDIEGQVLGMRSTSQQPVPLPGATVLIAGSKIDCGRRGDRCVAQTDSSGTYRFDDLPEGDYGLSFSYDDPTFAEGKPLGSQGRQVDVSKDTVETVSVVLLPEGVEPPPVPPDLEQRIARGGGYSGGYGGLTSNPFFWLWLFDRPYMFGYPRPPVVTAPRGGPVTVDRHQPRAPSRAGRRYTRYAPDGRGGAKPPPRRVKSRGVVRPGAAPVGGTTGGARALSSSRTTRSTAGQRGGARASSSSKVTRGQTRPGQVPRTSAQRGRTPPRVSSRRTSRPPRIRRPSRVRVPRIRAPSRGFRGGFRGGGFRGGFRGGGFRRR